MASRDGGEVPGGDDVPRHVDADASLPPELNPRGRRSARREPRAGEPAGGRVGAGGGSGPSGPRGPRRHRQVKRGAVVGVSTVLVVMSLAIVGVSGWAWWTYKDFSSGINRVNAIGPTRPAHDVDGKDQNILVVGNDDRDTATDAELRQLGTTRDGGSYNTDTMMLMHVPANGEKATVISFPRDSYVAIPGHGMSKLNSAYPDGINDHNGNKADGARLLVQTIENLTGLTIDHFVQVDLLGFYRISNAIGGVPVNLCEAQHEPNSGINLPKGASKIEGTQALAFVRQRYGLPNGDLDRIKRQQYFLSSAFRTISSAGTLLNPFKLQNLLKAVNQSLQMDNSLDPLKLAEQFQNLSAGNLIFKTIPTHGTTTNDAGSVVVVDPAEVRAFASQLAGSKSSSLDKVKTVAPGSFTVDVLNGSTTDGAATDNAETLRHLGFKIGKVDTTKGRPATLIEYPKGMQSQAKTLAAQIPGAQAQQTSSVQRVTLVLGADGLQVSTTKHTTNDAGHRPLSAAQAPSPGPASGMSAADTSGCIN